MIEKKVEDMTPEEMLREIHSRESPRGEKLDEMPDYETPNGVVAEDTRIPPNSSVFGTHPDSLLELHRREREGFKYEISLNSCPECKEGYLIYQGGCKTCYACGYSKCN